MVSVLPTTKKLTNNICISSKIFTSCFRSIWPTPETTEKKEAMKQHLMKMTSGSKPSRSETSSLKAEKADYRKPSSVKSERRMREPRDRDSEHTSVRSRIRPDQVHASHF